MSDRTTVLIADDHAVIRGGIRLILEHSENYSIVAEAENGHDAIELAAEHAPDIALIDVRMPDLNGIETTRKIHAADPEIAIIALSMHSDECSVTGMLNAGGRGYLLKTCDSEEILRAIDVVRNGKLYITSELSDKLTDRLQPTCRSAARNGSPTPDVLTPREREVLLLISEGLTSKEIGTRLGTAIKTVETHRTNIMRKLDLHSIAGLTRYAIREGLTPLLD